jgi:uroporphyrinogen decarboxylase
MHLVEAMSKINVGSLSLDSPETGVDLPLAAEKVGKDTVIIGNINPTEIMKDGTVEQVTKTTNDLLDQMRPYPNFILSTACDLPPGTPLENMKAFMKAGREYQ